MNKKAKKHHSDCACAMCNGASLENIREFERECIKKYGHAIRYIFNSYQTEAGVYPSIFTVGLTETAYHDDLELVLPVEQEFASYILNSLAQRIHKGSTFTTGKTYKIPELNNVPFYFERTLQNEIDKPLLRVMLADANMKLPNEEDCDFHYRQQALIGRFESEMANVQ